jgi:hypothetical protein
MPRAKQNLPRVDQPVTFYAYTDTGSGERLAARTKIVLYAKEIIDPRTNSTSFDKLTQRVAKFEKGVYQTDIKADIETLRNYNKENPRAKIVISTELKADQAGTKIIEKSVERKIVPLSVVKDMSPAGIKTMMKDIWGHAAEGETVGELLQEGSDKGFFE